MENLLGNQNKPVSTERTRLQEKYNSARSNLLIVVAFTVINIILEITQSNTYFMFSAFVPYCIAIIGGIICGKYPVYSGNDFLVAQPYRDTAYVVIIGIAFVLTALYLLSYLFSKKNKVGWLIFALVFFVIDTIAMFWLGVLAEEIVVDSIIDIVFHAWIIIILVNGIVAHFKLKKLPEEEVEVQQTEQIEVTETESQNSSVIRTADFDCKSRVLLEDRVLGHEVIYRRVKRTNELIVDGRVYDEYEALAELAHTLKAEINGNVIEAGYDGMFSFIKANGEKVKKKLRLY